MKKRLLPLIASLAILLVPVSVAAHGVTTAAETATGAQAQLLATMKSKGDAELNRRIDALTKVSAKITSSEKLTAANKTALTDEVNKEISGLKTLKTQLDSATTVDAAKTVVSSMVTDYRVYALVLPKVWLATSADAQIAVQTKLNALVTKLQTRIDEAKAKSKDVTAMQASVDDMKAKIKSAGTTTQAVETKVLALQPSDYNTDHGVLTAQLAQLKTAQTDITAAVADAKATITALAALK